MNDYYTTACRITALVLAFATSGQGGDWSGKDTAKSLIIDDESPFEDKIFGDWGGLRSDWANKGITVNFDVTYSNQTILDGGLRRNPRDNGNIGSAKLGINLDTGKAGLWPGGFLIVRAEGRAGDPVLRRAGATSPVNNDALLPLVPGRVGQDVWALSELTYMQFFSEQFGIVMGLINTDSGDANPIAGHLGSDSHFLNSGILFSNVASATVPNLSLGGGLVFLPDANNKLSFLVLGTEETAGFDPFDRHAGTTFLGEWSTKYEFRGLPGGMTFTGYYGIDHGRFRIADDPRVLIGDFLAGRSLRTKDNTWAVSWNGFQYLQGNEERGWGLFGRFGVSDGNPNPVRATAAGGIGGVGLFPNRENDRWGAGFFYQDFTNSGLLPRLGVDSEAGGEVFYTLAICPGVDLTFDIQVVDSALPGIDTAVVGGVRAFMEF